MVSRLARHVQTPRIVEAIERAEAATTGEIRVSVAPHFYGSVRKAAEKAFARMRMTHAPDRNGVLIFVVPSRREFVILGDVGVHEKAGQEFWDRVSAAIAQRIRTSSLTDGIVHGVEEAGRQLAGHFPSKRGTGGKQR